MLLRSTAGIEQSQGCEQSIDIVVSPRHCTGQPTDASRSFQRKPHKFFDLRCPLSIYVTAVSGRTDAP